MGCKACEPHTSACGKPVDAHELHGLSCRRSAPRQQRHSHLKFWITSYGERPSDLRCQQLKSQWVWCGMTTNGEMGPLSCRGPEENPRPGMWQFPIHMRSPTLAAQLLSQVQQLIRQHRTRLTSMPYWSALTFFYPFAMKTAGTWH